jgi:tetratricopeptide (TPR) repeat protein
VATVADVFSLALQHHHAGEHAHAERLYRQILQGNPIHTGAHFNLGVLLLHQHRYNEAAEHYRQVLHADPKNAEAHYHLGFVLQKQGKLDAASACYRETLRIKPGHVDALNNLGIATMGQRRFDEATECFREVLRVQPQHVDALNNLGMVSLEQGRLDDAEACYRQALRLAPDLVDAHNGLGVTLAKQGRFEEVLAYYDRALRLDPGHAETHLNRAMLWLLQGNWTAGWPEYEWRWQTKTFTRPTFRQPHWDGSPLAGRTLLLIAEQGLGDTLQFVRYVPMLRQTGGRVILQCQKSLVRLLISYLGSDVVAQGTPPPPFDVYCPLLSLPGILGVTPTNVPAPIPYLQSTSGVRCPVSGVKSPISDFGHRTPDTGHILKIGIAWQGRPTFGYDRQRSVPLKHFLRLAQDRAQLISLQKGPGVEQLSSLRAVGELKEGALIDFGDRLDNSSGPFMDTAAIIESLDLVICSDSGVAHLAGALGANVWVALPLVPDWRWQLEREDNPWYPTMRLFRQRRLDDWNEVFERIAGELGKVIARLH